MYHPNVSGMDAFHLPEHFEVVSIGLTLRVNVQSVSQAMAVSALAEEPMTEALSGAKTKSSEPLINLG